MDGVSAAFGTHVWGQLDSGKISIDHGERMASADIFTLTVRGEASHGSAPHLGHDAIVAATERATTDILNAAETLAALPKHEDD